MQHDFTFVEKFSDGEVDPSHPFRILPVGIFSRFGRTVEITLSKLQEMIGHFRSVPETPIPVTLEHQDVAGKVGDVQRLELRPDGLYAVVNWLPTGIEALKKKAYQFLSAEVLWGPTDYDGQEVSNVLTGLSLVNTPFFGNLTALYSMEDRRPTNYVDAEGEQYRQFTQEQRDQLAKEGKAMPDGSFPIENESDLTNAIQAVGRGSSSEADVARRKAHIKKRAKALGATDKLPDDWKGAAMDDNSDGKDDEMQDKNMLEEFWKKVTDYVDAAIGQARKDDKKQDAALVGEKHSALPAATAAANPEVAALKKQIEELQRKDAERDLATRTARYSIDLGAEKFKLFKDVPALLAQVPDAAVAGLLLQQFKALASQVDEAKLFGEAGVSGGADAASGPKEKFLAAVQQKMAELKCNEADAMGLVSKEHKDLYYAYREAVIAGH